MALRNIIIKLHIYAGYNGFAMRCRLAVCVSGVYLRLSAQARSWWAFRHAGTMHKMMMRAAGP
jgi:hypothetical protein